MSADTAGAQPSLHGTMSIHGRNNVHVFGTRGQPMILAHGYGCDQNMWRYVVPAFSDRFRVVLFDYVGAGQSDLSAYRPARYSTLDGYAKDVLEICEELRLTDAIFVGHSMSSMVGVRASILDSRRFERLVHIAPSARFVDDGDYRGGFSRAQIEELLIFLDENHLGWSRMMAPLIMGNPDRPELSRELENSFCRTDPDIARRWARVCFLCDCREDLPRYPCLRSCSRVEPTRSPRSKSAATCTSTCPTAASCCSTPSVTVRT